MHETVSNSGGVVMGFQPGQDEATMGRIMILWRRHTQSCAHRDKGRFWKRCQCPLWADGVADGQRYRRSMKTGDWKAARIALTKMERGETAILKRLEQAVEAWDASLQVEHSTKLKYMRTARQMRAWCEARDAVLVGDVTIEMLDGYLARKSSREVEGVAQRISRATAIRELQALRLFFSFCQDRAWAMGNPARKIRTPREGKERPKEPYTAREVAAMLRAADEIGRSAYERARARTLILLLRNTGLRIGDAMMLERARVRDGQLLLYTHKTGQAVWLPIPLDLQGALAALPLPLDQASRPVDSGHYFWNGQAKRNSVVYRGERLLSYVFKRAGLVGAHAHRFRHTLAVDLLAHGATFEDVAIVLGNSPRVVERHYAPWSQSRQNRVSTLMRSLFGGSFGGYEPALPQESEAHQRHIADMPPLTSWKD